MRCPHCGKGKLFRGFLKGVDRCDRCGEEYSHHRADDLPPYLTVFIVGHIVVALFMGAETGPICRSPPIWRSGSP